MSTPTNAADGEYTELAMAARAPLYLLPVLIVVLTWGASHWYAAVAVWVLASLLAYLYGRWVRDDEDVEPGEETP